MFADQVVINSHHNGPYRYSVANLLAADAETSFDGLTRLKSVVGSLSISQRLQGRKGICLWPFGVGAENDTFIIDIEGVRENYLIDGTAGQVGESDLSFELLAAITCTLGTRVGVAGGIVLNTERYSKTITISKSAKLTDIEPLGKTTVVHDGDGGQAYGCVIIPDLFDQYAGIRLRRHTFVGTTEANALIMKW